jgi:glucosylceramidase
MPSYPQNVINGAGQYVDSVAWHCYATNVDWTLLTQFHETNPNIKQYMTECWTPASASWNQAAYFTMGPLHNWASGVMAWTPGTNDQDGPHLSSGGYANCRGLVTIATEDFEALYKHMLPFEPPRTTTAVPRIGNKSKREIQMGVIEVE